MGGVIGGSWAACRAASADDGGARRFAARQLDAGARRHAAAPMATMAAPIVNSATLVTKDADGPPPRACAPTSPKRSTSIRKSSPTSNGGASISIPLADSITTWRMAMMASTTHGALGSGTSSLKVFQDFFVDLDLPVTLTQGDRVSIPVAVYNYSRRARRRQPATAAGRLVRAGGRRRRQDRRGGFRPRGRRAVHARSQAHRQIQAHALRAHDGRSQPRGHRGPRNRSRSQRPRAEPWSSTAAWKPPCSTTSNFPPAAIPDASKIFVRLYPGPLSQVIEGMDASCACPAAASSRPPPAPIPTCWRSTT